jgi:hypothetical protein
LLDVFPVLKSDDPTFSSGCGCEPYSSTGEATLVVFSGDPFIDTVCGTKMVINKLSIELVISNAAENCSEN